MSMVASYSVLALISLGHSSMQGHDAAMLLQIGQHSVEVPEAVDAGDPQEVLTSVCPDISGIPKYSATSCEQCEGCLQGGNCFTGQVVSPQRCEGSQGQWCCKGCFKPGHSVQFDWLNTGKTENVLGQCNPACALTEGCTGAGFIWNTIAVKGDEYYGFTTTDSDDSDDSDSDSDDSDSDSDSDDSDDADDSTSWCKDGILNPKKDKCCKAPCGDCGGEGCGGRPGGAAECCASSLTEICLNETSVGCKLPPK